MQSPRGFSAFLLHVDEAAHVDVYMLHDKGSVELQNLTAELYRLAELENELESFLVASARASTWRSTVFRTQRTKVSA